jgi:hypothetical protein
MDGVRPSRKGSIYQELDIEKWIDSAVRNAPDVNGLICV